MYCKMCGKEIVNDSVFCSYCGTKQYGELKQQPTTIEEKVFHFSGISRNNGSIKQINDWLSQQQIELKSIEIFTNMNTSIPLAWESSLVSAKLLYVPINQKIEYQMDYISAMGMISFPSKKIDKSFAKWQTEHSYCKVLWKKLVGHSTTGMERTHTLYFIYVPTKSEN